MPGDLLDDPGLPADDRRHPEPVLGSQPRPQLAPQQRPQGLLPLSDRTRETIMSLTPLVALILFFVTDLTWYWFLAIPIMGALLYGSDRKRRRR